jgi:hypothetical protein
MPVEAVGWLVATQLVVGLGELALLGFVAWKARALMHTLAKTAAGTEWREQQVAELFTKTAASLELSATAAWNASVACQAIARDIRPLVHGQTDEEPVTVTVDLNQLDADDEPGRD